MKIDGWKYYNRAAIPMSAPHVNPNILAIKDKKIWRMDGHPILARWTTDFDCGYETNWWYVIKDSPFDISNLKAKRRYEITKGQKNFEVLRLDLQSNKEKLFEIQEKAYAAYPEKYRPSIEKESFIMMLDMCEKDDFFGAYFRETNELVGYARLHLNSDERVIDFITLKAVPEYEKYSINAALIAGIMRRYSNELNEGYYICDGARNTNHETRFQDYLEKYFGFRKAYCNLHIAYNPKVKWLIKMVYPFRKTLQNLDDISIIHRINAVLKMEEVCRGKS